MKRLRKILSMVLVATFLVMMWPAAPASAAIVATVDGANSAILDAQNTLASIVYVDLSLFPDGGATVSSDLRYTTNFTLLQNVGDAVDALVGKLTGGLLGGLVSVILSPLLITLDAALTALLGSTQYGTVNYSALKLAVSTAASTMQYVETSDDGTDIAVEHRWMTAVEKAAYTTEYNAALAQITYSTGGGLGMTQAEINTMVTELKASYEGVIKYGLARDLPALLGYIQDAEERLALDVEQEDNGNELATTKLWVPAAAWTALTEALAAAEIVAANASATTEQIGDANEALIAALAAAQPKPGAVNYAELTRQIKSAVDIMSNSAGTEVTISSDDAGTGVAPGAAWMTKTDGDAYTLALTNAQAQLTLGTGASQGDVNLLGTTLTAMLSKIQVMPADPDTMDTTGLQDYVDSVQFWLDNLLESPLGDGSDVAMGVQWVDTSDTLYMAVSTALGLADAFLLVPVGEIASVLTPLTGAVDALVADLLGNTGSVDYSDLTEAISDARGLLSIVTIDDVNSGANVPSDQIWMTSGDRDSLLAKLQVADLQLLSGVGKTATSLLSDVITPLTSLVTTALGQKGLLASLENVGLLNGLVSTVEGTLAGVLGVNLSTLNAGSPVTADNADDYISSAIRWVEGTDLTGLTDALDDVLGLLADPTATDTAVTTLIGTVNGLLGGFSPTFGGVDYKGPLNQLVDLEAKLLGTEDGDLATVKAGLLADLLAVDLSLLDEAGVLDVELALAGWKLLDLEVLSEGELVGLNVGDWYIPAENDANFLASDLVGVQANLAPLLTGLGLDFTGVSDLNADVLSLVGLAVQLAPEFDGAALDAAILEAEALYAATVADTDAANVPLGTNWALATDRATFRTAIDAAIDVSDGTTPVTEQSDVDDATQALIAAQGVFVTASKPGTKALTGDELEYSTLVTAIEAADAAILAMRVSTDGSDVPAGTEYVLSTTLDTLHSVLNPAKAMLAAKNAADQTAIGTMVTNLNAAVVTFNEEVLMDGSGGAASGWNYSALETAIEAADVAILAMRVSGNGQDVPAGTDWVTAGDLAALVAVLDEAKAMLAGDTAGAQQDVDDMVDALDGAVADFTSAGQDGTQGVTPSTPLDYSELFASIQAADAAILGMRVSADGSDVPAGTNYVTPSDLTALTDVLDPAKAMLAAQDAANQGAIDAMVGNLDTAVDNFTGAALTTGEGDAVTLVYTALEAAIKAADAKILATRVSTTGADVPASTKWVEQADLNTLNGVLDTAKAMLAGDTADVQQDVDDMVVTLKAAVATFVAASDDGSGADAPVTMADLMADIAAAQARMDEVTNIATSADEVADGEEWTTTGAKEDLTDAIATAQGIVDTNTATPAEIATARGNLATALATFEEAVGEGTMTDGPVTMGDLEDDIAAAQARMDEVTNIATSADTVPDGEEWTTTAAKAALTAAIATAQGIVDTNTATESEIITARANLATALATFEEAVGTGTMTVTPGDTTAAKAALDELIGAAEDSMLGVVKAADGTMVENTKQWASTATYDALDAAITAAQTEVDDPDATLESIATAQDALESAQAAFRPAAGAVNYTDLVSAIAAAMTTMTGVEESADGEGVSTFGRWVTTEEMGAYTAALGAATTQRDGPRNNATQDQLTALIDALNATLEAIEPGRAVDSLTEVKTALQALVAEAEGKLDGVIADANGLTLENTVNWASQGDIDTLLGVIADAKALLANASATESDITTMIDTTLANAIAAFIPAPGDVDYTALETAIADAVAEMADVVNSVDGKDVPTSARWVTDAERTVYTTALAAANLQADGPRNTLTQDELDAVMNALTATLSAIEAGTQGGGGTGPVYTALNTAIAEAEALIEATEESEDGAGITVGTMWAPQTAHTTFQAAINAAKALVNVEENQVTIDAMVTTLGNAITAFTGASRAGTTPVTPGDDTTEAKAALTDLATAAADAMTDIVRAADGSMVENTKQWVSTAAYDALDAAIAAAQAIVADDTATAEEVADAQAALQEALDAFKPVVGSVSYTALESAITDAEAAMAGVLTSVDGSDVSPLGQWMTAAEKAAYDAALLAITNQRDGDRDNMTQAQLDALVSALNATLTAIKAGTSTTPDPNAAIKQDLLDALAAAETALAGVVVDDNNGLTLEVTVDWISQANWDLYLAAVADARALMGNLAADPADITALIAEIATYTPTAGTVNYTSLESAITGAQSAMSGVVTSTDGTDVLTSAKWVTPAEMTAYQTALAAAQAQIGGPRNNMTQGQLTALVDALTAALAEIESGSKSTGGGGGGGGGGSYGGGGSNGGWPGDYEPIPVPPTAPGGTTPAPTTPSVTNPFSFRVLARSLNVRSGPGTSFPKVSSLKANDMISVIGYSLDGLWAQLSTGNWVSMAYLIRVGVVVDVGNYIVTLKSGTLNVRSAPGTGSPKIGSLRNNAPVMVNAVVDGWAQIEYNGSIAFVSVAYLR